MAPGSGVRRASLVLSVLGGAVLVPATLFLVSVGWGETTTTTMTSGGAVVSLTHRTASPLESTPGLAVLWVVVVLALSVAAALLIRFGGRVGGVLVVAVAGLVSLAGIMTIGLLVAPAALLYATSALLAEVDRGERRARALAAAPPPAPPRAGPALG